MSHELKIAEKAANHIFGVTSGIPLYYALRAAVTLNIAEILQNQPLTVKELAEKTATNPEALFRLLRFLANEGFFTQENDVFSQNEVSHYLRDDVPFSLKSFVMLDHCDEWLTKTFNELDYTIKTGKPAFEQVYNMDIWQYHTQVKPELGATFSISMTAISNAYNESIVAGYNFSSSKMVMDVGGAYGSLLTVILRANPHLNGILFDIPEVIEQVEAGHKLLRELSNALKNIKNVIVQHISKQVEEAIEIIAPISTETKNILLQLQAAIEQGEFGKAQDLSSQTTVGIFSPQLRLEKGSFFEKIPSGADVFCLRYILHDWDDEKCIKILSNCRIAAPQAKILVIERVILTTYNARHTLAMDLWVMAFLNGAKERTEQEYAVLFEQSGYQLNQVIPVTHTPFSILEGTPK